MRISGGMASNTISGFPTAGQTVLWEMNGNTKLADLNLSTISTDWTIQDTGDLFVPILNTRAYRRLADSAGTGNLLVERAVRRFLHCDFTQNER